MSLVGFFLHGRKVQLTEKEVQELAPHTLHVEEPLMIPWGSDHTIMSMVAERLRVSATAGADGFWRNYDGTLVDLRQEKFATLSDQKSLVEALLVLATEPRTLNTEAYRQHVKYNLPRWLEEREGTQLWGELHKQEPTIAPTLGGDYRELSLGTGRAQAELRLLRSLDGRMRYLLRRADEYGFPYKKLLEVAGMIGLPTGVVQMVSGSSLVPFGRKDGDWDTFARVVWRLTGLGVQGGRLRAEGHPGEVREEDAAELLEACPSVMVAAALIVDSLSDTGCTSIVAEEALRRWDREQAKNNFPHIMEVLFCSVWKEYAANHPTIIRRPGGGFQSLGDAAQEATRRASNATMRAIHDETCKGC